MKSLLRLIPYMRPYRWRFLFGVLFVLLANALGVQIPAIAGLAINVITGSSARTGLVSMMVFLVAVAGLAGCFRYLMRRVLIDTSRDIEFDFRNSAYRHLQKLDASYYDGMSTGDVMSRMTNDIDAVRMVLGPAVMYTANTIFVLPMVLGYMLVMDWQVTLAGLSPLLIMPVLVNRFGSDLHRHARGQQDQLAQLTTYVQESLAGIRVIKAYGQEESGTARFDGENDRYIDQSMRLALTQSLFFPLIRFVAGTGLLAILYLGARRIIAGNMDYGTLVSMVMYFGMLVWPLVAAGWVINLFQRASAAMDRMHGIFGVESNVKDRPSAKAFVRPKTPDIEFRGLTFAYEGAAEPALRDIDLKIPFGGSLGIVGRVGSGKSTIVHLLLRLYRVEDGTVFIGGTDINDWPSAELRRTLGIVFQETFLFSESIGENIRFGAQRELTDGETAELARMAGVHDDIAGFPHQYGTMLGERGINLSGGQKQRVSLARTLGRDADVLILDDSLSAVDTHTEEAILGALRGVMKDRTTLVISHRISTVALCDEIVVLEDGAIAQRGTHGELLEQKGLYAELWERQQLEEEVQSVETR